MQGTELKCSHLTAQSGNKEIHTEIKLTLPNLIEQTMWAVFPVMETGSYEPSSPPPWADVGNALKWCHRNKTDNWKWLGKAVFTSAEGCAIEGCAPVSCSRHTEWEVRLVFLPKMQVPSKVKDHRVKIFPGHRLSLYRTTGLHEGLE